MQGQLVGEREYKVALKGKSLPVKAYGYQAHL
jgi:hypothetical protein